MKLVRMQRGGQPVAGVVREDVVVDLGDLFGDDTIGAAAQPERVLAWNGPEVPLAEAALLAPVRRPSKFLAAALNYRSHVEEIGATPPPHPIFFNKQVTCFSGPGAPIVLPSGVTTLDYEGELGVVVGRRAKGLTADTVGECIAGYVVANDVSVREWQQRAFTMTMGKSYDTHGPVGPFLVTPDEVGELGALTLTTSVNGVERQRAHLEEMIFDVTAQVLSLSETTTLEPGDVVLTGTPSGVAFGGDPTGYLRVGDEVVVEIERVGRLVNHVVAP